MIRNYRDLTRLEMEQVDKEETIILIPLGALEQHGNQAPLGTDDIIAEAMVKYLGEELDAAGEKDFPILAFPVIPIGLSTEHKNFCGSITFKPDTYYHMLYDICVSLAHHGFRKIAFLVCHGGNAPVVQILSRELRSELGISPFILSSGAFGHPDVKATVSEGNIWDFPGGEMETSMVTRPCFRMVPCRLDGCRKTGKQKTGNQSASVEILLVQQQKKERSSCEPAQKCLYLDFWKYVIGKYSDYFRKEIKYN